MFESYSSMIGWTLAMLNFTICLCIADKIKNQNITHKLKKKNKDD